MAQQILKVAVTPILGIFEGQNKNGSEITVTGDIESDLLKMVSQGLGCSYQTFVPDDVDWGFKNDDGSWSGIMGMLDQNEVDMGLSHLYLIEEREEFPYSFPYHEVRFTFATIPPGEIHSPLSFVYAFETNLWITLVVCLLTMPLIFKAFLSGTHTVTELLFNVLRSVLQQSTAFKVQNFKDYLLVVHWLVSAVFISLIYSSVLYAFLTVPTKEEGVKDLEALLAATKSRSIKSIAVEGKATITFFAKSDHPTIRSLFTIISDHPDWDIPSDPDLVWRTVFEEKDAVVLSDDHIKLLLGKNVFISDDHIAKYFIAIFLNKNSLFLEKLNQVIHRITASGVLQKMYDHYSLKKSPRLYWFKPTVRKRQALTMDTLSGPFVLLVNGYAVAFLVFLVELLGWKLKKLFNKRRCFK